MNKVECASKLGDYSTGKRESTAAMSLRHRETNLRHKVHTPLPGSTRASAIQKIFFETLFHVFKKKIQWQKSVTKDFNYLLFVMYSAFDYSFNGLCYTHLNISYAERKIFKEQILL